MRLLLHTNVLDAYRADLVHASRNEFTPQDGDWLIVATLLEHAVALPENERTAYLRNASDSAAWLDSPSAKAASEDGDAHPLLTPARRAAESAEEHGAFAVATLLLDLLRVLAPDRELEGRLAYQQARVLRKLGDLETAEDILLDLQAIAEDAASNDLRALAYVGLGALARVRGNFPAARQHFGAAAVLANDVDPALHIGLHAHHGILIAAAVAQDFDSAIRHGAVAVEYATSGEQRAEILTNLSSALMDAGQLEAAMHGFLSAMAESTQARIRMAAVGGASICAARLGKRRTTQRLIRYAEHLILSESQLVHETTELSRELYVASAVVGDQRRADAFKHRAESYARQYGYYEILHQLEAALPSASTALVEVSDAALDVAAQLASSDVESMLVAATDIPLRE